MWWPLALLLIFAPCGATASLGAIASSREWSSSRHFSYDGVRRIQEVVTRQEAVVIIPGGAGSAGVPPAESGVGGIEPPLEAQPLDPIAPGATLVIALPAGWDQREYVWGPDYVDELAWQIAGDGTTGPGIAYYSLLDANYNVMALAAGGPIPPPSGAAAGTPMLPAGTVVEQYVWSPYGELLSRDVLDLRIDAANGGTPSATYGQLLTDAGAARPPNGNDPGSPGTAGAALVGTRNKVGHQGLFFERFDGLNTDPPLVPTDATAVTADAPGGRGKGLYYNRWRWYDSQAGRFVSEDMNGAGMAGPLLLAYHGGTLEPSVDSYGALAQYGDGMSLFAYLASSPLMGSDPAGLEGWWDEDIDEAIDEYARNAVERAFALTEARYQIGHGAAMSALYTSAAFLWDGLVWDLGEDALLGLITGGLGSRACFIQGTMVLAADGGCCRIEDLSIGDSVAAFDHLNSSITQSQVTGVSHRVAPEILEIALLAEGNIAYVYVTPEHPIYSPVQCVYVPARSLVSGDLVMTSSLNAGTVLTIQSIAGDVDVFNITVDGLHNYFVGDSDGPYSLVHNECNTLKLIGRVKGMLGATIKAVMRQAPKVWRRVRAIGNGWRLIDEAGVERVRFMRPNPNGRFVHEKTGYWRLQNEAGEYLDEFGNVVSKTDQYFHTKTHIPYSGVE